MRPRVLAVSRDPQDARGLFLLFEREPRDAEVDALMALLGMGDSGVDCDDPGLRDFAPVEAYETAEGRAADRTPPSGAPAQGQPRGGGAARERNFAAEAAMACGDPAFKVFLEARCGLERPLTDERCAQKVRSLCGVTSRAEFNRPGRAADAWRALRRDFMAWKSRS